MNAHRERTKFGKDKRRKHHHWLATIFYRDGERTVAAIQSAEGKRLMYKVAA